jgi:hypothetical protein
MANLHIITDKVTGKQYARDLDIPGSTYQPYTPPATPSTSPIKNQVPATPTTGGTTTPTSLEGSASFLAKSISDISKSLGTLEGLTPAPEETEAALAREKELARKEIALRFGQAREDIIETRERGLREISEARQMLGLTPAVLGARVREFTEATEDFISSVNKSIERLTKEEELAYEKNDLNYANQVRQAKLDYINMQRQFMQDRFNILSNVYNLMLTGRQIQRQEKIDLETEASNKLNTILQTYSGRGISFNALPPETQSVLEDSARVLGIPIDVIKDQIATVQRNLQIVREGDYTSIYDKNTGKRIQRYYAPASNIYSGIDFESFIRGNVSEANAMKNPANRQKLMLLQKDALGGLIWNTRKDMEANISKSSLKPSTPQDLIKQREMAINDITNRLAEDPQTASNYLGLNYPISSVSKNSPEYSKLRGLVKERVEEFIPDSWIYNKIAEAKNPFLWAFEQLSTQSQDSYSQASQYQSFQGGGGLMNE